MRQMLREAWNRIKASAGGSRTSHGVPIAYESIRDDANGGEGPSGDARPFGSRSPSQDYTELMGGSVPCPSCKGTGRIPKEMEETLVALIPFNDERLKPKRTFIYVLIGIAVCVLLAGGAIFMLVPRSVELSSSNFAIDVINVVQHTPQPPSITFNFMNHINVSNANYYVVQVVNTTAQMYCNGELLEIVSKFQPWARDVVGSGFNSSHVAISPLSNADKNLIYFNSTVTLTDIVAEYCQQSYSRLTPLYVNMQFDVIVSFLYFNHREQASLTTVQQVCCVPTGNCTSRI